MGVLQVKECQCSGLQVIDYRSEFCSVEHSQAGLKVGQNSVP